MNYEERAKNLRDRLYIQRITVTELANRLNPPRLRQWVSRVLNGKQESKTLLDEIEEFLDGIEEPEAALAA